MGVIIRFEEDGTSKFEALVETNKTSGRAQVGVDSFFQTLFEGMFRSTLKQANAMCDLAGPSVETRGDGSTAVRLGAPAVDPREKFILP